MYDQAGMIREIVKWDYELRNAEQLTTVVDRALAIAASEPRGPVYLFPAAGGDRGAGHRACRLRRRPGSVRRGPAGAGCGRDCLRQRACWRWARRPLIVTANAGRDAAAFGALAGFTERFAIPVVQHRPRYLSLPSSHAMNLGFDPARLVPKADAILVIESDVPWIPSQVAPGVDCKVVHCGLDPLFTRYTDPRLFPAMLPSPEAQSRLFSALTAALEDGLDAESVALRRRWIAGRARDADRRLEGCRAMPPPARRRRILPG